MPSFLLQFIVADIFARKKIQYKLKNVNIFTRNCTNENENEWEWMKYSREECSKYTLHTMAIYSFIYRNSMTTQAIFSNMIHHSYLLYAFDIWLFASSYTLNLFLVRYYYQYFLLALPRHFFFFFRLLSQRQCSPFFYSYFSFACYPNKCARKIVFLFTIAIQIHFSVSHIHFVSL